MTLLIPLLSLEQLIGVLAAAVVILAVLVLWLARQVRRFGGRVEFIEAQRRDELVQLQSQLNIEWASTRAALNETISAQRKLMDYQTKEEVWTTQNASLILERERLIKENKRQEEELAELHTNKGLLHDRVIMLEKQILDMGKEPQRMRRKNDKPIEDTQSAQ